MLIIDRAMPKTCDECFCHDAEYNVCQAAKHNNLSSEDTEHKPDWCPLKQVVECQDCEHWDKTTDTYINGIKAIGTCETQVKRLFTVNDGFCRWAVVRGTK